MKFLGSKDVCVKEENPSQIVILRFSAPELLSYERMLDYMINKLNEEQIKEVTKGKEDRNSLEQFRDAVRHIMIKYSDKIDLSEEEITEWQYSIDDKFERNL